MRRLIWVALAGLALASCSSIDCPLNNTVYTKYRLAGTVTTLVDTLTVSTPRLSATDTVLLNKAIAVDSFSLPMSYGQEADILYFDFRPTGGASVIDTVTISKTNEPHFESVDCSPAIFHTLKGVTYTRHKIDSIVVNSANVSYDATKAHFLVYIKSSDN